MSNEAAERLTPEQQLWTLRRTYHSVEESQRIIEAALAAERRATVERIRAALDLDRPPPTGSRRRHYVRATTVLAILAAEAL